MNKYTLSEKAIALLKSTTTIQVAQDNDGRMHSIFFNFTDRNKQDNFLPIALTDEQIQAVNNYVDDEVSEVYHAVVDNCDDEPNVARQLWATLTDAEKKEFDAWFDVTYYYDALDEDTTTETELPRLLSILNQTTNY